MFYNRNFSQVEIFFKLEKFSVIHLEQEVVIKSQPLLCASHSAEPSGGRVMLLLVTPLSMCCWDGVVE